MCTFPSQKVRFEALGAHTDPKSVTEGNFSPDLCVDCITLKPNHCLEQDQWGRDSSDIMKGIRKFSKERGNFLDSTLMHSVSSPKRRKYSLSNLEALQLSDFLKSLKSPQINTPSPVTQVHRLSFLVGFFFSARFLVTIPATCFKSSFWQTTNKLKHKHS